MKETIDQLKDENSELKIEVDNLKRDKTALKNSIEKMANQARTHLHNLEKTLDLFRTFNRKIKCPPPLGSKPPEPNLNECEIINIGKL